MPRPSHNYKKIAGLSFENPAIKFSWRRLSTQAELSYDSTVAVDITLLEIVKE